MSSGFILVTLFHYIIRVEKFCPLAAKPLECTGQLAVLRGLLVLRNVIVESNVGVWVRTFPAEEFMSQLMPIFEGLRQREDLPCSYPLAMGSSRLPSYHWVNKHKCHHYCNAFCCVCNPLQHHGKMICVVCCFVFLYIYIYIFLLLLLLLLFLVATIF
jgi:hypothetical protein